MTGVLLIKTYLAFRIRLAVRMIVKCSMYAAGKQHTQQQNMEDTKPFHHRVMIRAVHDPVKQS